MKKELVFPMLAATGTAIEEVSRRMLRSKGQQKLQNQVDGSAPKTMKEELVVSDDHIHVSIIEDYDVNLSDFQESSIKEKEACEWKSLISTLLGENAKSTLAASSLSRLIKCDVPLKDLCRIKDNPEAMRGFVVNDGRISKHASFTEAGLSEVAPLMVYQCLAAVTSQYYQHVITERLNAIDIKLDSIMRFLAADDQAKLKVAYNRFLELSKKNTYDIADKQIASESSRHVEVVREKYRKLLSAIKRLDIGYKWSDKKEAEQKIRSLQESHYFDYLEMAMQSEVLTFMASAISIKVANYLGNDEDVKIYADRMNLDYWNNYVQQFEAIKHDVIKYLELQADASWLQGKSIAAMKDAQKEKFDAVEDSMINLQKQFDYKTVQYILVQEDNTMKKYISLSKV